MDLLVELLQSKQSKRASLSLLEHDLKRLFSAYFRARDSASIKKKVRELQK